MSENPLNLALRFILELAGLAAMAYWGWNTHAGAMRWLLAIGVPLIAAALWGTFRVPNDPGDAPVAIPGLLRLALEAAFFITAVFLLYSAQKQTLALWLGGILIFHYLISYDRILWLLKQ